MGREPGSSGPPPGIAWLHEQIPFRFAPRRGLVIVEHAAGSIRKWTLLYSSGVASSPAQRGVGPPRCPPILLGRRRVGGGAPNDAALRGGYDRQRASLWLALVGLWGVIAIGSVLGHIETMLMGAIGGFLAPLIDARLSEAKQSTWGVRVLSPVGGALRAVGGPAGGEFSGRSRCGPAGRGVPEQLLEQPDHPGCAGPCAAVRILPQAFLEQGHHRRFTVRRVESSRGTRCCGCDSISKRAVSIRVATTAFVV
jgi:hypothetical protein